VYDGIRHDFFGDFAHEYDSAIGHAKEILKDDKFWNELKKGQGHGNL